MRRFTVFSQSRALVRMTRRRPYCAGGSSVIPHSLRAYLQSISCEYNSLVEKLAKEDAITDQDAYRKSSKKLAELRYHATLLQQLEKKEKELEENRELLQDKELGVLARGEVELCERDILKLKDKIIESLLPHDEADEGNALVELRAGVGGKEAGLFVGEMLQMYQKFAAFKSWRQEVLSCDEESPGEIRNADIIFRGHSVFGTMKYESGVHRVQRIPTTETQGRTHTSTITVAVLPEPTEIQVEVRSNDLKIDTFRATGAGGQHVNTTDSAVRITHLPTGTVVSCQMERSQIKNRELAMYMLRARLFEAKQKAKDDHVGKMRQQQIGRGERHERIRTYNYAQDRITDHRIGRTVHNVEEFLEGSRFLDDMIQELRDSERTKALAELTSQYA